MVVVLSLRWLRRVVRAGGRRGNALLITLQAGLHQGGRAVGKVAVAQDDRIVLDAYQLAVRGLNAGQGQTEKLAHKGDGNVHPATPNDGPEVIHLSGVGVF